MSQIQIRRSVRIWNPNTEIAPQLLFLGESKLDRFHESDVMDEVERELVLGLALEGFIPTSELPADLQQLPQPDRKRYKHSKNIRAPGVAERRAETAC